MGHSPNKVGALMFGQVTILSKSRFSVLEAEKEDGGEKHEDEVDKEKKLDVEVEKEIEKLGDTNVVLEKGEKVGVADLEEDASPSSTT